MVVTAIVDQRIFEQKHLCIDAPMNVAEKPRVRLSSIIALTSKCVGLTFGRNFVELDSLCVRWVLRKRKYLKRRQGLASQSLGDSS